MMILASQAQESGGSWQIERDNKANWSVDEHGALKLTTEAGAIWSGTTNTVKNVIHREAGKENFTLTGKMNYIPGADYAEAGIILYVDDDNYTMVNRKAHSGYGGRIFSMTTEINGNPKESPAEHCIPDQVESRDIYLKLVKEGNSYSGYYSTDNENWNAVWENQILEFSETPDIGVIGYNGGVAVFDYLELDGERITFEEMNPVMDYQEAELTQIFMPEQVLVKGAPERAFQLPETVSALWNGSYRDVISVEWESTEYDKNVVGKYEWKGRSEEAAQEMVYTLYIVADKEELNTRIVRAENKLEGAYTEESFRNLQEVLGEAKEIQQNPDKALSQECVDKVCAELEAAIENLEVKGNMDTLQLVLEEARRLSEEMQSKTLYDSEEEADRENGSYAKADYEALLSEIQNAGEVYEALSAFIEMGQEPEEPETPAEKPEEPAEPEIPAEESEEPVQPETPEGQPEEPAEPEIPAEKPEEPAEPEAPADAAEIPTVQEKEIVWVMEEAAAKKGDELLTEEERQLCSETVQTLLAAMDSLKDSRVRVAAGALEEKLKTTEDWMAFTEKTLYSEESWNALEKAVEEAHVLLETGTYTQRNVDDSLKAITDTAAGLERYYYVSVNGSKGGSVMSDAVNGKVRKGSKVLFQMIAEKGYLIDKMILNGVETVIDAETHSYTVDDVEEDLVLQVTFKEKPAENKPSDNNSHHSSGDSDNSTADTNESDANEKQDIVTKRAAKKAAKPVEETTEEAVNTVEEAPKEEVREENQTQASEIQDVEEEEVPLGAAGEEQQGDSWGFIILAVLLVAAGAGCLFLRRKNTSEE